MYVSTHTPFIYTLYTHCQGQLCGGMRGTGLITPTISDLLPWYYPENQHCSCDHVSLHPTGESRVSKEWKIEPSHISQIERHGVQSKERKFTASVVSPVSERSLREELSAVRFSPSPTEQLSSKLVLPRVPFTTSLFTPTPPPTTPPVSKLGRITPFCFSSSAVNRKHNNVHLGQLF